MASTSAGNPVVSAATSACGAPAPWLAGVGFPGAGPGCGLVTGDLDASGDIAAGGPTIGLAPGLAGAVEGTAGIGASGDSDLMNGSAARSMFRSIAPVSKTALPRFSGGAAGVGAKGLVSGSGTAPEDATGVGGKGLVSGSGAAPGEAADGAGARCVGAL